MKTAGHLQALPFFGRSVTIGLAKISDINSFAGRWQEALSNSPSFGVHKIHLVFSATLC